MNCACLLQTWKICLQRGGQVAALRAFGGELMPVVEELNEALGGR
jgi:hypothetical protein